jgi:hypothetical protein
MYIIVHTQIVCIGRSLAGPCSFHNIITAATAAAHSSSAGRRPRRDRLSCARSCSLVKGTFED